MRVNLGHAPASNTGGKLFWATVIISIVVLGWTITIAYVLGHEIELDLKYEAEAIAQHIETQSTQYMSKRELSLVAVQGFFDASANIDQAEFSRFTSRIMTTMPGIRSINRVERDLVIRWVSPLNGNEKVQNLDLKGKTGEPAARKALETGKLSATNPIELIEGGNGILFFLPLQVDGRTVGLVQSVNTLERYLEVLTLRDLSRDANLRLSDGAGHMVFESGPQNAFTVTRPLVLADQVWRLDVSSKATWLDYLPVFLVWPIGLSIWAGGLLFLWSDVFAARKLSREVTARTAELAQSLVELQTLDRMKNDFLSVVTHELRTPLTSIKGYAEFLEDEIGGRLGETQKEFVSHIQYNAEQLEMLVDDLLDLARLEAGKFTLRLQATDARALAGQAIESFQPQAKDLKLTLEAELPEGSIPMEADPHRVTQVLNNLLSNALKFTPEGGTVRLALRPGPDHVEFVVSDTGIGISPENQERVFAKFYQVDSQLNRAFKGTGLGLAITRGLVEAHHGDIDLKSELGQGTTMIVTLPRRQPGSES